MAVVYFNRAKSKVDPNRDANALLLAQVQHLREAEKTLPVKYHSNIFSHAVRTEGEAARYVQAVTEAIHRAHLDATAARGPKPKRRKGVIEIAAVADVAAEKKARARGKKTAAKKKGGRKK